MHLPKITQQQETPTGAHFSGRAPVEARPEPAKEPAMDTSSQLFSPAQLDAETRSAFGNPSLAWNPVHGPIARCKGIAWQWHRDDENNTLHVCVCDSLGFRDAWGMPISDERAASILAEQAGTGAFYTAATNAGRRWEAEAEAEGWR